MSKIIPEITCPGHPGLLGTAKKLPFVAKNAGAKPAESKRYMNSDPEAFGSAAHNWCLSTNRICFG